MKIEQYRQEVTRTLVALPTLEENLLHMAYGITTEIGELHDIYKKKLAYGKEIDLVNLKEELGDILWYVFNGFNFLEITEEEKYMLVNGENNAIEFLKINNYFNTSVLLPHLVCQCNDIYKSTSVYDRFILIREYSSLYYDVFALCNLYEFNIEDVFETNINKLKVRFPEKFTQEQALNRDLEKERQTLENKNPNK